MRYYSLTVSDPDSGQIWVPTSTGALVKKSSGGVTTDASGASVVTVVGKQPYTFNSHPNGPTAAPDPGAINMELDMPVSRFHTPQGSAVIHFSGVGLAMIGQAANLNGQNFVLRAGMGKGLPLANPAQAGTILQGTIYQAFGNWEGVEQTLDLICFPGGLHAANGIAFDWQPGTSLASALATTFAQAFPDYDPSIKISSTLQCPRGVAQQGCYRSLESFASYLMEMTRPLGQQIDPAYPGVSIFIDGTTIYVYDLTIPNKTVQLNFQDIIGQPTWLDSSTISFKTVMRADIDIADQVRFPTGVIAPYALTSANAAVPNAPSRSKTVFQGLFSVLEMHYYANFRQPDARSWCVAFRAAVVSPPSSNLLTASIGL